MNQGTINIDMATGDDVTAYWWVKFSPMTGRIVDMWPAETREDLGGAIVVLPPDSAGHETTGGSEG